MGGRGTGKWPISWKDATFFWDELNDTPTTRKNKLSLQDAEVGGEIGPWSIG